MSLVERLNAAYAPLAPRLTVEATLTGGRLELTVVERTGGSVVNVVGVGWPHEHDDDRLVSFATARAATLPPDSCALDLTDDEAVAKALLQDGTLLTVADFAAVLRTPARLAEALARFEARAWAGREAPELYPLTPAGRDRLTPALFRQLVAAAAPTDLVRWLDNWLHEYASDELIPSGYALMIAAWQLGEARLPPAARAEAIALVDRVPDFSRRHAAGVIRTLVTG